MPKTILVVEDNEFNMKVACEILATKGYATLRAETGMKGLQLAREHHPDLILIDIQLPDISGLEVTKLIKGDEALKDIPVIAVTAFAMEGDKERILEACDGYIAKPIVVLAFLKAVEQALGEAG